ncbi:unnamed protein product, partial [Prorocentrum cordatum]
MRCKFFGFNVCSLIQHRRLDEIALLARGFPFHFLLGTRLRAVPSEAVRRQTHIGDHDYYHFGYGRGPFTNRAAGVTIGVRRRDLGLRVHRVLPGPAAALGRAGMVRVVTGSLDVTAIAIYFPPPGPRSGTATWRRTVDVLLEWLNGLLDTTPERSTPIIFTDLNDSFAVDETSCSFSCIGPYVQSRMGYAARGLREVLHRHHFACATTFFKIAPTYNGEKSSTWIDHYALPAGALPRVSKLITMTKAARQLQLYPSKGILRDHSPVLLEADLGVPSLRSSQISASWNFDAIETALQTPGLREGFLEEANLALQRAAPSYLGYFESNMIDAGYASFLDALAPIAKKHFGRARRTPGAELAQHRLQVRRLLRGRAVLRAMGLPHCHYDFQIRDFTNRIRGIYRTVPHAAPAEYDHGCIPRRRRENAILGTQILADRLRSARVWHIAVFDDMKNAFGCCEHKRMNQGLLEYLPAGDVALLSDRRTTHLLHLEGVDRPTTLHLQSGALMGDPSAPDEFRVDFARPLQEWLAQFQDPALCVSCPVFGREVYAGLFKYVDDLAYFLLLQEGALSEAVATAREAQAKLGNALAAYGHKQNTSKQVLVPRLCGYKATRQFYAAEVISLLFGRVGFENAPTLSEGRLTVHANPFAVRFVTDVYRLELLTDYEDWRSVWGEDIHALFHDDYISHQFLAADVSVLRKIWQSGKTELDIIDFGPCLSASITFASGTCLSYLRDGLAMATPKPKWMLEKRPPGAEAEGAPVLAKAKGGGPPQKDKGGKSSAPTPGSASDAAAASGPNSKQQRNRHLGQIKDMGFTKKQANFINVMVKQTLMTTQLVRELWAAGVDTYFLTADLPEIEAVQEAGATYSHEVRARGKGRQLGPPHLHIFNGFVTKLLERGPALGQRTHAMLKDWHARVWCELQPHDLYDMVRLFRVTKCYDQNKRKLHLMMRDVAQPSVPPESDEQQLPSPLTVRGLLQKALEEIGGRRALGAAPPARAGAGAQAAPLGDAAPCEDLEELRQKMCSTLQGALEGGRLGAATEADVVAPMEVEEQRASPPAERQSAAAPSKDESLEAIRNEALAALARGAEDGSLEKALAEVRVERAAEAAEEGQGLEQEELRAQ